MIYKCQVCGREFVNKELECDVCHTAGEHERKCRRRDYLKGKIKLILTDGQAGFGCVCADNLEWATSAIVIWLESINILKDNHF
jgi:hypothetical protein